MESNQKDLKLQSQNQRCKESILEEGNTRGISGKITWEFLKGIIFLICLSLFTFQSLKFYFRYTSHPIRTNKLMANVKTFKLPAITICNRSAFPRSQFCSDYPDVCQKPNNLEEFCEKRPVLCRGNFSDLKKEVHSLPYPYKTDCMDYEDLWKKNNKTGPRSQEMCKEWCSISYYRHCWGCTWAATMIENSEDSCLFGHPVTSQDDICVDENKGQRLIGECEKNCKVSCMKAKYRVNLVKRAMKPSLLEKSNDRIGLSVFVKDTQVVITKHAPLYGCSADKSIPVLRSNSFSGGFSDEFHNSLNCLRVCRKFNKVPAVHWHIILYHLQKFMRTDMYENWRRCDMKSLLVNEIYVVCSSKVNSRNNESTSKISFWDNFSISEYVTNALLDDFSNFIFWDVTAKSGTLECSMV
ncbi:hypothetical protein AVEN_142051-1 [Araneus ventricosus]|uniref:Uncharacterized protein n=1 Tax=Araneus ventricosus TaxID=182803 RepID=A0A4Y2K1P9_ARAVE|nr:hypothetical protein AVEN_142051-1 [Araneus ventricosus]